MQDLSAGSVSNSAILTPGKLLYGSMRWSEGIIESIVGEELSCLESTSVDIIVPGVVDLHCSALERYLAPRPGAGIPIAAAFAQYDAAVAAAGITTCCTALRLDRIPGCTPGQILVQQALGAIRQSTEAQATRSRHFIHLRCELTDDGVIEDCRQICSAYGDLVKVISATDHSAGRRQFKSIAAWENAYLSVVDGDRKRLDTLRASREEGSTLGFRARSSELASIAGDLGITFATHDDDDESHVLEAANLGASMCEFPTSIEAAEAANRHGLAVLSGTPNLLRGKSHTGNVSTRQVIEAGLVSILASDYLPGATIPAIFLYAGAAALALAKSFNFVGSSPAALLGFADRGALSVGSLADFVRVRQTPDGAVPVETWRAGVRIA
ncbi:alpha-D-ribose 1-methylphosphonate 5-triphosphate diphosphatase [Rhizobium sp. FKL33]|uniref:alpha-D-ribose 1-methylphosphonate 5-triphosphate diphosphatase n=1 Tax=Rhizobium sp. FKL33 TaxID=2562307 RepID=UPI0010C09D16|nr:alpha-D-ribose 1-methylphosphonate 5-triphosphate diphosphatase [Rhizobium sp. FKL33]